LQSSPEAALLPGDFFGGEIPMDLSRKLLHAKSDAIGCSASFFTSIESVLLSNNVSSDDDPLTSTGEGDNLVRRNHAVEYMFFYLRYPKIFPNYFDHRELPPFV
jgi:hypothetical protein